VDIASKGGNFLLNVGPTAQGVIPPESVQRLEEVGRWMKANGASVYGTTAGPWKKPPFDGRGTVKGTTLYVHVFNWPDGPLSLAGLKGNVRKAEALDPAVGEVQGGAPAGDVQTLTLQRPWRPDPIDTVVAVEFREAPSVDEAVAAASPAMPAAPAVAPAAPAAPGRQAADGSIVLRAADATVHGNTAKYEANKDCVGFWTNAGDWVSWDVTVDKPGVFVVEVTYAADKGCGGAKYVVSMGRSGLTGQTRKTGSLAQFSTETSETGSWTQYRTDKLGPLKIQEAGKVTISVKAISKPGLGVMNLRAVELKPVND
jgi:alpha-L-fucosidase